jgi:serine/threonine protein kinase
VHRDIKLENILIEDNGLNIKLTDFGFAKVFDGNNLNETVGSPIFMPPEIIKKEKYDSKVDIWSAGVVAYLLLTGKPPFIEVTLKTTKSQTFHNILTCDLVLTGPEFEAITPEIKDFLIKTLDKDPKTRLSV